MQPLKEHLLLQFGWNFYFRIQPGYDITLLLLLFIVFCFFEKLWENW